MKSVRQVSVFFLVSVFILQACGLPGVATEVPQIQTQEPVAPPSTEVPAAQPAIVHTTIPSSGSVKVSAAHDNEESTSFDKREVVFGDQFDLNRFERPFTAETMDYLPQVDIVDISMTQDDNFYYVQIKLAGVDPATNGASGSYGVDFDVNIDGKAEFIVIATNPNGPKWTTDGVSLYSDINNDVGGSNIRPDDIYAGDGFENLVFDSGKGEDPDTAWVRFANNAFPVVEIAFKKSWLEAKPSFMWSVTASAQSLDPSKFYFNDTITQVRAGSPIKGEFYPLKELAGVDNTCRLPAGFQATGTEPLGCQVAGQSGNGGDDGNTGGQPGVPPIFNPNFNICDLYPLLCGGPIYTLP